MLLVALSASVFDRAKTLAGGPLAPSADEGITGSGIRLDPGEWFTDRTAVLVNKSARPAELLSIRHVGTVGKLRDGRIYVALGSSSSGAVTGAGEGFPPKYYSRADLHDPAAFAFRRREREPVDSGFL